MSADSILTYSHPEEMVRSEVADIAAACAKRSIPFAFTKEGKKWYVHCPAAREDDLLLALKDAGV